MPYSVTLVQQNVTTATCRFVGQAGLPTTFNYLLYSVWGCLAGRGGSMGLFMPIGSINLGLTQAQVTLTTSPSSPQIFSGNFALATSNVLTHLLVSISPADNRLQVYANDVPLTMTSGVGWTGSGTFSQTPLPLWMMNSSGSATPGPGAADVFVAAPTSFFDLSLVANRRKFINANLTPVDLGSNASSVLGTPPPVYLTARSGVANNFAANNGTGGAWEILSPPLSLMPSGACVLATRPTLSSLALDNLIAIDQTPHDVAGSQIFLMWSDDRGHSYGSPVGQPIGQTGQYLTSVQWQRLGYARDRVFKLEWSVPTATALQGAFIEVDTSAKS